TINKGKGFMGGGDDGTATGYSYKKGDIETLQFSDELILQLFKDNPDPKFWDAITNNLITHDKGYKGSGIEVPSKEDIITIFENNLLNEKIEQSKDTKYDLLQQQQVLENKKIKLQNQQEKLTNDFNNFEIAVSDFVIT
ncbi:MAG TPA: hypothetical protein DCM40_26315, partial [Maribacter sp.]|nr:hypothetical protein [Maribacter sp.]